MMGLDKPQLFAKFEVVSPNRCRNIIEEHQNFEELPYPKSTRNFSSGCELLIGSGKPNQCAKVKVASFTVAEILKGKPQISGVPLAPGHTLSFV